MRSSTIDLKSTINTIPVNSEQYNTIGDSVIYLITSVTLVVAIVILATIVWYRYKQQKKNRMQTELIQAIIVCSQRSATTDTSVKEAL